MEQVRVGLVGLGQFGQLHASILHHLPTANLTAVCDIVPEKVDDIATRYGVENRYTDYDAMLNEVALDCVFIITDEALHAEMALKAIERGLHVFVEKPLATTYEEGKRVAAAAEKAGTLLQVGFILRFETRHAFLKEQIQSGAFGRLATLRFKRNCSKEWFIAYGHRVHPVYETAVHDIDLCLWYVESACQRVYATHRSMLGLENPDTCVALLQFANGTVAVVETSWLVPRGAPDTVGSSWGLSGTIDARLEIVGTERSAQLEFCSPVLSVWSDQMTHYPELTAWPRLFGQTVGALREEVSHFVSCVLENRPSPIASVADAVEGLKIAEAIIASAERNEEIVLAGSA